ncbi:unnamed protein product [Prunus armeniaca]|uniref:Uncharacterized protein n=1 Tax=Prunus armeniaca TaxID=36596 RepID=A0A6J5TV51_PRUAR|nr:unnamed protein product [Prunus armeniaca]
MRVWMPVAMVKRKRDREEEEERGMAPMERSGVLGEGRRLFLFFHLSFDNEILSSVLKKTRRPLSKLVGKNFAAISIQGTSSSNALEDGVDEGSAFKNVSPNIMTKFEVRGIGIGNPLDAGSVKKCGGFTT